MRWLWILLVLLATAVAAQQYPVLRLTAARPVSWLPPGATWGIDFVNQRSWPQPRAQLGLFTPTTAGLRFAETAAGRLEPAVASTAQVTDLGYASSLAATNLIVQSQAFSTATWTATGASATDNAAAAPNGAQTASTLIEDGSTGQHKITLTTALTTTASQPLSASIYIKASGRLQGRLQLADATGSNGVSADFDTTATTYAGAITAGTVLGVGTLLTSYIQPLNPGFVPGQASWYRVVIQGTVGTSTNAALTLFLASAVGTISYAGNGSSGMAIWGAQINDNTNNGIRSYAPTAGTTQATRGDQMSALNPTQFQQQIQGTIYVEWLERGPISAAPARYLFLLSGTVSNYLLLQLSAANKLVCTVNNAGTITSMITSGSLTPNTIYRAAYSYAPGAHACTYNGFVNVNTATVGTPGLPVTAVGIGQGLNAANNSDDVIRTVAWSPQAQGGDVIQKWVLSK